MEEVLLRLITFLEEWEVRVFIILSLALQILLIMLGNRRKYVCKLWIRIILWCAYLLADWVAVVSLGITSKNTLDACHKRIKVEPGIELRWFWAQFFVLHLGGPDTITAYSLEDNELWLRHLVGMVIQTGLASYVLLVALRSSNWLPSLSVLIFIAGAIKYGERLYTLRAANSEHFRDSMLPEPDPGPNYAKFMEEYTMKEAEGYEVGVDEVIEIPVLAQHDFPDKPGIHEAYDLFLTFKRLFADAILSFQDRDSSRSYFQNLSGEQAFDVVEIELGFMFDELYTKASVVYNLWGCILRMITFSFTLFAWMAFLFVCEKGKYKQLDLVITHLLLGVAICLEIYAVFVLVNSDWTCRLIKRGKMIQWLQQPKKKRWSEKMSQHNLLDLCVWDKSALLFFPRSITKAAKIDHYLEKHWHKSFVDVSIDLKNLIFIELKKYTTASDPAAMWSRKGSFTLGKYPFLSLDGIQEREFDQGILLWHIATDICYTLTPPKERIPTADHSKHISDYMLYLLMVCPFMLPIGIGMIRLRDTCAEAKEFFRERATVIASSKVEACNKLLEVSTRVPPGKVKGDRSKSVLFDACKLAKSLLKAQMWNVVSSVWVEMLAHAATHCGGRHHAHQLRKGGELLSHVWLLMAHLGITEQFQISQGHARAKIRSC
ncbi:uncharacterized protein LOC131010984 [Salvia miltiorrhiza]|uniref:uncharacterized protein LOC131010984 n=1 Tax=Salvia miltiorrhiza TaxID=226208 RepID=UPI0025AD98AF|nr:uncharacterized protein LOC131010984 [Salvia miltiorrhiza]XP_057794691.1 uncharacterized protein LOC131010984 [Salvia miltiorrhiza]XP_057794692.1 uncharacterized protein LOC131010984 [Salvia miltiorrhiza]XP_057794693.1 uncharacterized protein LOC131010984 [Salvia miltiorrhiza]XP_057794694.1 uncharacterized protein LOC131010984 [Salvia miltiorrhiza]XP_057794695.1 uncharacterized protein LOC131010984 [Salvia miltiorrhiza]